MFVTIFCYEKLDEKKPPVFSTSSWVGKVSVFKTYSWVGKVSENELKVVLGDRGLATASERSPHTVSKVWLQILFSTFALALRSLRCADAAPRQLGVYKAGGLKD